MLTWRRQHLCVALLMTSLALLYFWNLSEGSLRVWDESLTAERSREILVTGDWLSPHTSLKPDFHKPPLYYWLTAILLHFFGESEFAVRFWSAAFGLGCMIMVYRLGTRTQSWWTGVWAVFLLATTAPWMNYTRKGMLDSAMLLSMLGMIHELRWGPPASRSFRAGLWFAFGCMVKNPLPAIAILVPIIEAQSGSERRQTLRDSGRALLLGAALGLPWYGLQAARWGYPFFERFVVVNILHRTTTALGPLQGGPLFYFDKWWSDAPLTLVFFATSLVYGLLAHRQALGRLRGYAAMALTLFILITAVSTKRDTYLLLVYPFASLFCAGMLEAAMPRLRSRGLRVTTLLALIIAALVIFTPRFKHTPDYSSDLKDIALRLRPLAPAGDVAVTIEQTGGAFMFYSHVVAYRTAAAPLEEFVTTLPSDTGLLVLLRHEQRAHLDWPRIARETERAAPAEVCHNGVYVVVRLPPVTTRTD